MMSALTDATAVKNRDIIYTSLNGAYRCAITVAKWHSRPDTLVDESAYWFSEHADECGMDPWAVIDGTDADRSGDSYDVWFASGQCVTVKGDKRIYVKPEHAAQL
jgi:hypothetical protein